MTFILRKEDKFLRNIYDREVLKESKSLDSLENCYVVFQKFVSLPVLFFNFCGFENDIKHVEPKDVADIGREHYQDCEGFSKVYDEVGKIETKNSFKKALSEKLEKIMTDVHVKTMRFPIIQFFIPNISNMLFSKCVEYDRM